MNQDNHVSMRITNFILQTFPLARKRQLSDTDQLIESGILDSLGILDLVTFLEGEFAVGISDEELTPDNFQTIQSIAAFIHGKNSSTMGSNA